MPLYDYVCRKCGKATELWARMDHPTPVCCDEGMERQYSIRTWQQKWSPPLWVDRIDDIQKRETQNGERMRFVHPKEVSAT